MTDIVTRLRNKRERIGDLMDEAADEIERLRRGIVVQMHERSKAADEIEQWRKLNSERVDEIAGLIHRLRESATQIERLEARVADLEGQLLQALGERPMRREGI